MDTVKSPRFSATRWREGYAIDEVDDFLSDLEPWFAGALPNPELAERIRSVHFSPVRLRLGYDMSEVDVHLDELVALASQGHPPR